MEPTTATEALVRPNEAPNVLTFPDEASWIEARSKLITSTDVAGILGLDRWSSPAKVYARKRGLIEPEPPSPQLARGKRMEPYILEWYQEETGYDVERAGWRLWVHPKYPWLAASRDATAITTFNDLRNVEAKSARMFGRMENRQESERWGEPGTDEVPDRVLCQAQIQMACAGLEITDVPVILTLDDFRIYQIEPNERFMAAALERLEEFHELLAKGIPPAIDPTSDADADVVKSLYKSVAEGKVIDLDPSFAKDWEALVTVRATKAMNEKTEKALKTKILAALGEAEIGRIRGSKVSFERKQIVKHFKPTPAAVRSEIHLKTKGELSA